MAIAIHHGDIRFARRFGCLVERRNRNGSGALVDIFEAQK
jgi:hypothetical protein